MLILHLAVKVFCSHHTEYCASMYIRYAIGGLLTTESYQRGVILCASNVQVVQNCLRDVRSRHTKYAVSIQRQGGDLMCHATSTLAKHKPVAVRWNKTCRALLFFL